MENAEPDLRRCPHEFIYASETYLDGPEPAPVRLINAPAPLRDEQCRTSCDTVSPISTVHFGWMSSRSQAKRQKEERVRTRGEIRRHILAHDSHAKSTTDGFETSDRLVSRCAPRSTAVQVRRARVATARERTQPARLALFALRLPAQAVQRRRARRNLRGRLLQLERLGRARHRAAHTRRRQRLRNEAPTSFGCLTDTAV